MCESCLDAIGARNNWCEKEQGMKCYFRNRSEGYENDWMDSPNSWESDEDDLNSSFTSSTDSRDSWWSHEQYSYTDNYY